MNNTLCVGDSGGHQWILQKQGFDEVGVWPTKRGLFSKTIILKDSKFGWSIEILSAWNMWYCSKCRTFDKDVTIINTREDLRKQGFAVRDEDGFMVFPILTNKEYDETLE